MLITLIGKVTRRRIGLPALSRRETRWQNEAESSGATARAERC